MSYSGNPSLSSDVQQRVLTTFEQTLDLAREGSRQEALLGCDFVLRMDPQFQPAQVLQERLRASDGPVRVDDLKGAPPAAAAAADADDPFADLDGLGLDLPDLLPDAGGGASDGLRGELQSLLDQRRFQELMATAQREAATVTADPELQRIVGQAQELMEAEPYVLKFLASARQALQAGQADEAGRLLDKARSLDPPIRGSPSWKRPGPPLPPLGRPSRSRPPAGRGHAREPRLRGRRLRERPPHPASCSTRGRPPSTPATPRAPSTPGRGSS